MCDPMFTTALAFRLAVSRSWQNLLKITEPSHCRFEKLSRPASRTSQVAIVDFNKLGPSFRLVQAGA